MSATVDSLTDAGIRQWIWWAHQKLELMENRRGPDDFENRYTAREMEFLINAALKERGKQYGGIQGGSSNKNTVLLTVILAVGVPAVGWIIGTLNSHSEQLAQIRCQLNPANCLQLQVPHGH